MISILSFKASPKLHNIARWNIPNLNRNMFLYLTFYPQSLNRNHEIRVSRLVAHNCSQARTL